jgi:hypothetical protein
MKIKKGLDMFTKVYKSKEICLQKYIATPVTKDSQ